MNIRDWPHEHRRINIWKGQVTAMSMAHDLMIVLALIGVLPFASTSEVTDGTARLKGLEGLALSLSQTPALQQAKIEQRELFLTQPHAKTQEGTATLDDAASQTFYGAVVVATNTDPHHPEVLMHCLYEHVIDGQRFPSALHGGLQNPDNVYRFVPISNDSRYELRGNKYDKPPAQVVYELMSSIPGVPTTSEESATVIGRNLKQGLDRGVNQQIAILTDRDIEVAADGSYTITMDSEPADGRPNHIRTTSETRALYIRDTLSDWAIQSPDKLRIVRTAGPDTPVRTNKELIADAAELVPRYANFWINLAEKSVNETHYPTNDFAAPNRRSGGWGYISHALFDLEDNEALVFTTDPKESSYHAVMLGNHWWIAMDAARHTGSLNVSQVAFNRDGTITYVIAPRDPGVYNWLDSAGLRQGVILVRWQDTQLGINDFNDAITDVKVVLIDDLKNQLPAETVWVGPEARRHQLAARYETYQRRFKVP